MKLRDLALLLPVLIGADHAGAEGSWQFKPGGIFQYDWLRVYEEAGDAQFAGVRRARTIVSVKAPGGFDAKAEFDLAANAWTDAYLRWRGAGHSARFGQYKQPLYLDELTSNRNLPFMEQAMPGSLAIAHRLGVGYGYAAGAWRFDLSAYGGDLRGRSKGDGLAARLGFDPVHDSATTFHLGLSLASESPNDKTARLRSRAELSGVSGLRFDTGTISGIDGILRTGLEALWIGGAWMVKSEYLSATLRRDRTRDAQVDGWYLDASWFPTGHQRSYQDGLLEGPALGEGERAFELAVRLSRLDLNDREVRGGEATTLTLGVNCYLNRNVLLMANYVHVDGDRRGLAVEPQGLQARVQLSY
jgi:phosphate-selective porin OprO/OprP